MKKTLLFALVLIISACSNSNDSETPNAEASIMGVWTLVKETGESGTWETPWDPDEECGEQNRVTFSSNGDFNDKDYGGSLNNCVLTQDNVGYWEINNDILSITLVEDKADGAIDNGFIDDYKIFELTNAKLVIGEYEPNVIVQHFYEFERVN